MAKINEYKLICMIIPAGIPGKNKNELFVSVCFNINKYCKNFITSKDDGTPYGEEEIKKQYKDFVDFLIKFQSAPTNINIKADSNNLIKAQNPAKLPFDFILENKFKLDENEYKEIRRNLWEKIFSLKPNKANELECVRDFHPESTVKLYNHPDPKPLISDEDFKLISQFDLDKNRTKQNLLEFKKEKNREIKLDIIERLNKINEFGKSRIQLATIEYNKFLKRHPELLNYFSSEDFKNLNNDEKESKQDKEHFNPVKFYTKLYTELSSEIEIDEIVHSFSKIADDPVLSRLMGLTIDYKLTFNDQIEANDIFKLSIDTETFKLFDNSTPKTNNILALSTPVQLVKHKEKYAYLIQEKSQFFEYTLLKKEGVELQTIDIVSKVLKIADYQERAKSGQSISNADMLDALPRGIMFTHSKLQEIIKPVDIANGDPNFYIDPDKPNQLDLHDEYFVRGHRVNVSYKNKFFPLTTRSIKIKKASNNEPFYYNGNVASCIHFDTPTSYMEDGKIESITSNVLFEYSGELLKLKTAFAKAYNPKKVDHSADSNQNLDADGLEKSEERWNKVIQFYSYPNRKPPPEKTADINSFYDIPEIFKNGNGPKLRFYNPDEKSGQYYTFIVHQEYLNGWGLPLDTQNGVQLSIADLVNPNDKESPFFPTPIPFRSAENKKAPILVHKRNVDDELSNNNLSEKPALEHLVVRSDNADDTSQYIDERHILPPKIDLETAFWHGLLSPSNLSPSESYDLKTRSYCPFSDEKDRHSGDNKNKICPECNKMNYCGGTQLKQYYPQDSFTPNFITDPTVKGVEIGLFWELDQDKKLHKPCSEKQQIDFKSNGINTKSYLLVANGAKDETFTELHEFRRYFQFSLKKGAELYAELKNVLTELGEDHLKNGVWFKQFKSLFQNHQELKIFFRDKKNFSKLGSDEQNKIQNEIKRLDDIIIDQTNIPKIIMLTHAVKEPLITPEILKLASTPKNHKFIEHIHDWLKEEEYQRYELGVNVIANRIDKNNPKESLINSTHTQVELTSHFERLDAIRKIELLKEIIPTGALELWVRKEEFIDNPEQIVLSTNSATNHLPNEPIVKFSNRKNVFTLDYKIEFSNKIMSQLKNLKNIEDIDSISDVFRSLITKLNLQYDFKTTKFEEREYYLKDISKFKGFFTDEKMQDLEKIEEFTLPKIKDVMKNLDEDSKFRFKVIVLNNSQPTKPDVAFAVTTIQEARSNPSRQKTISIQKGNIVTIYLKRGRLKSGKDERVGVIVDADSLYNNLFKDNELISKAGRDIVSDRYSNRSQYLQYGDIIIPEINEYNAGFDNELGIYHFLPKFDIEKQLWKFEVELDIKTVDGKQLHNPFINFSLVHFQPFSINYNDKTADSSLLELKNDCRISDVENSTWCYLLPERKLSVFFDKPGLFDAYGEVDLTVSFDHESLHHFSYNDEMEGKAKWKVRSNYILTVQGSNDGIIWSPVNSKLNDGNPLAKWEVHHPLLNKKILQNEENMASLKVKFRKWSNPSDVQTQFNEATQKFEPCEDNDYAYLNHSIKYTHFRVRFIEVEWFKDETWEELVERYKKENPDLLNTDAVDNEEMRIRFVELIY